MRSLIHNAHNHKAAGTAQSWCIPLLAQNVFPLILLSRPIFKAMLCLSIKLRRPIPLAFVMDCTPVTVSLGGWRQGMRIVFELNVALQDWEYILHVLLIWIHWTVLDCWCTAYTFANIIWQLGNSLLNWQAILDLMQRNVVRAMTLLYKRPPQYKATYFALCYC